MNRSPEALEEVLGVLAHQLKSPVVTIQTAVKSGRQAADPAATDTCWDIVARESERLANVVESLLLLYRAQVGGAIDLEPVRLPGLIGDVIHEFCQARAGREVTLSQPEDPPLVQAEPVFVREILFNLLDNGDKYTPKGEPVEVALEPGEGMVVVSVSDRGPGVSPDELEAIFQPLVRSRRNGHAPGLGLGLAVCRRLVNAQGGAIWAELPGTGLRVRFTLPLYSPAESGATDQRPSQEVLD